MPSMPGDSSAGTDDASAAADRGSTSSYDRPVSADDEVDEVPPGVVVTPRLGTTVPGVVGLLVGEALEALTLEGYGGEARLVPDAITEQGTVIFQDPHGGADVPAPAVVRLTVSGGPPDPPASTDPPTPLEE